MLKTISLPSAVTNQRSAVECGYLQSNQKPEQKTTYLNVIQKPFICKLLISQTSQPGKQVRILQIRI